VGHALGNIFTAYKEPNAFGDHSRAASPFDTSDGAVPVLYASNRVPKPYVKWSNEPARAQDVPAAIARAYYLAMQPPCGPTFVSIPVDDWDQRTELLSARQVSTAVRGDPDLLAVVGDALDRAERPHWLSAPASTGTVRGTCRCQLASGTTHWCGSAPTRVDAVFPKAILSLPDFSLPAGKR